MSKVSVKFVKSWRGYARGEVAGFDEPTAQALVDGGVATSSKLKAASKPATGTAGKSGAKSAGAAAVIDPGGDDGGTGDGGTTDDGGADDNEKP